MVISKPRHRGGRHHRRGRRNSRRREQHHQRTAQEQLDYEMELMKAQREGREEEFKAEERKKMRARASARLDEEMDEYFKSRPKDDADKSTNAQVNGANDDNKTDGPNKRNDNKSSEKQDDANSNAMEKAHVSGSSATGVVPEKNTTAAQDEKMDDPKPQVKIA